MPSTKAGCFKLLLIFGVLLAFIQLNAADDADAAQQKFRDECIKEQGKLTPEEVQRVNDKKVVTKEKQDASENLQCFLLCMYKKNGIIKSDDKWDYEATGKYLSTLISDKTKLMAIVPNCAAKKSDNSCKSIYDFESCIVQHP